MGAGRVSPSPWLGVAGVALGIAKSRLILDRTARRLAARIRERGDGRCFGGFLSPWSWAAAACMAILGRLLRSSPLPGTWIGFLLVTVGAGLLLSSRITLEARQKFL